MKKRNFLEKTESEMDFEFFLGRFLSQVAPIHDAVKESWWELATRSSDEAARRNADLNCQLRVLYSDRDAYVLLRYLQGSGEIFNPLFARQLEVLINSFKGNMLPAEVLAAISNEEAALSQAYSTFRADFEGRPAGENDLKDVLRTEPSVARRMAAWDATKQVGAAMAPGIRRLVALRNQGAREMGYPDFWRMSMELQEIDSNWLLVMFDQLAVDSDAAYQTVLGDINRTLAERFGVPVEQVGPWAWGDPFCQEDPLGVAELDRLIADTGIDIVELSTRFYDSLGFDVREVIARSDLYEREGKNPHGYCEDFSRDGGDVRILVNLRPTMRWTETWFHEVGHAIYFRGFDWGLPWLLRDCATITTEAVALLTGGQIYRPEFLRALVTKGDVSFEPLVAEAAVSRRRWNLIFSRWVLVMVHFEAGLYANPDQDLNRLWWSLVERYQGIRPPEGREGKDDWATKMHIALAPCYYQGYLLGNLFATMLQERINQMTGGEGMYGHPEVGRFLHDRLFYAGLRRNWDAQVNATLGEHLNTGAWLKENAS